MLWEYKHTWEIGLLRVHKCREVLNWVTLVSLSNYPQEIVRITILRKQERSPYLSVHILPSPSTSCPPPPCLPAVQMWQDECGAHAMPLTHARWLFNLATGVHGTRTSRITTCRNNKEKASECKREREKKKTLHKRKQNFYIIISSFVDLNIIRYRGSLSQK